MTKQLTPRQQNRINAWQELRRVTAAHPPGTPSHNDPKFQDRLEKLYSVAYGQNPIATAAAEVEIFKLLKAVPPDSPNFNDPAHQTKLRHLAKQLAGEDYEPDDGA